MYELRDVNMSMEMNGATEQYEREIRGKVFRIVNFHACG